MRLMKKKHASMPPPHSSAGNKAVMGSSLISYTL